MAKVQSFADKAAKLARKNVEITCPKCGKKAKAIHAKVVNSVKSPNDTWKFLEKNATLCDQCLSEI